MSADLGTADAQNVDPVAVHEEETQTHLSEEPWTQAVCQEDGCDFSSPIRPPTCKFRVREERDQHADETGHTVDVDEFTPGQVRRFRAQFSPGWDE